MAEPADPRGAEGIANRVVGIANRLEGIANRVEVIATPIGPGRVTLWRPEPSIDPRGILALSHGAGGQSWSADILAARDAALAAGWAVALVDQPWRLAGRRVADRPDRLDQAWPWLVARAREMAGTRRLVVGGRSAGARVAARTATLAGAAGVLCLSFPLHPPGKPHASRAQELVAPIAAGLPVVVIQGQRDPFGSPDEVRAALQGLTVVSVPGTHTLSSPGVVAACVGSWLAQTS